MKKTLLSSFTLRAFMLVMTFLGAANAAWADEVTVTKEMTAIATANNWTTSSGSAAVCYTSFNLDDNITISTSGEANCGSFWGTDWRLYQAKSGNVTITAAENCTLKSITITYSNKNGGQLDGLDSDVATELSGSSVTYNITNSGSATNGQVKITKISVTYENGGTQTDTRQASDLTVSSESIEIDLSVPMDVRLVATTESTGAVTFTGYDESIITVTSINEKAIKVSPQAVGSTSIIVSVAADDNYKAGSKTVAVTISDSDNPEPGTKDTPYTVAEAVTFINTLGSSTSSSEVYVKGPEPE